MAVDYGPAIDICSAPPFSSPPTEALCCSIPSNHCIPRSPCPPLTSGGPRLAKGSVLVQGRAIGLGGLWVRVYWS